MWMRAAGDGAGVPLHSQGLPIQALCFQCDSSCSLCSSQLALLVPQDGLHLEEGARHCLPGGTEPYQSEGKGARASPARPPLATIAPALNNAHGDPMGVLGLSKGWNPGKIGRRPQPAQHGMMRPYMKQGMPIGMPRVVRHTSACQGSPGEHTGTSAEVAAAEQCGNPASRQRDERARADGAHAEFGAHGGRDGEVNASESAALEVLASLRMLAAGPGSGSGPEPRAGGRVGVIALRAASGRVRKRPVRCPAAGASSGEDSSAEESEAGRAACRRGRRPHPPLRAASARAAAAAVARSEAAVEAEARLMSL